MNATYASPCLAMSAMPSSNSNTTKNTFAPSPYQAPIYGRKQQMAPEIATPTFTDKQQKELQKLLANSSTMPGR